MKKYFVLLVLLVALSGVSAFACCGGESWRHYEDAIGSHPLFSKADGAARSYLSQKQVASGLRPFVDDQALGFDYNGYLYSMADNTTVNALAIVFMVDHDLNVYGGNTSGSLIGNSSYVNRIASNMSHRLDNPSSDCHLNHPTAETSAEKALSCPHHEKHWTDYIEPEIKKLVNTQQEGS